MQSCKVYEIQPMSISVQPGGASSAMSVRPSQKDNPKDDVNKDTHMDDAQKNIAEQDGKKTKTIQHLLSDWRTAYAKSKKVILLNLSF